MTKFLYKVEGIPILQNRAYEDSLTAINCPAGDICLVQNLRTGLIYNEDFKAETVLYDKHYNNERSLSEVYKLHLDFISKIILKSLGTVNIVEIGCGKGVFLETLLTKGFEVTGFDPAYEGNNQRIKKEVFRFGAFKIADGLILSHVLEHIQNPIEFLNNLKIANGGIGRIYIEVPCFDWILAHRAWWDITYEHVNYFRLSDFSRIFGEVIESGYCFGDQYLYVVAELGSIRVPSFNNYEDLVDFPSDFTDTILKRKEQNRTESSIIWGAASKGVIFTLLSSRAGITIKTVIDINPAKQGKFMAGTGLKIKLPDQCLAELQEGATILVMNSNYLDEIKKMTNNNYHYATIDSH